MLAIKNEKFGLIKPYEDAHTMGINAAAGLLLDCGYTAIIADKEIEEALGQIESEINQKKIIAWIRGNNIAHLGVTYRLDPTNAVKLMGKLMHILKEDLCLNESGGTLKQVFFAGLPDACKMVKENCGENITVFAGGESAEESLLKMGVPLEDIPVSIKEGSQYDKELMTFGRNIINRGEYCQYKNTKEYNYAEFGTKNDSIEKRLANNFANSKKPLIRAHCGPYSSDVPREESVKLFLEWCSKLKDKNLLDILSIGTSQLSQSNFGENWDGKKNGGGVPVNSAEEYRAIYEASRPLLLRTYSGTKNIVKLANIYEENINICWHALSLWWFNQLDNRGPNNLYDNLVEHIETIKYIAKTNKPLEANVSHHFSFRGGDDVTYIVSAYLAAKLAKKYGIRTYILQNMLNTPRSTWGIQDVAKARVLLKLVKSLEDDNFRVVFQPRAGLDFFKPDINEAKAQLAAVTALMDDIDPKNYYSPNIIHVVSYSEAMFLATPDVLNESIQITQHALNTYRKLKNKNLVYDVDENGEVNNRFTELLNSSTYVISSMEKAIPNLYSPEGFYLAFVSGWLPVPSLWDNSEEFRFAKKWKTNVVKGAVKIVDEGGVVDHRRVVDTAISNMDEAKYIMMHKHGKLL